MVNVDFYYIQQFRSKELAIYFILRVYFDQFDYTSMFFNCFYFYDEHYIDRHGDDKTFQNSVPLSDIFFLQNVICFYLLFIKT